MSETSSDYSSTTTNSEERLLKDVYNPRFTMDYKENSLKGISLRSTKSSLVSLSEAMPEIQNYLKSSASPLVLGQSNASGLKSSNLSMGSSGCGGSMIMGDLVDISNINDRITDNSTSFFLTSNLSATKQLQLQEKQPLPPTFGATSNNTKTNTPNEGKKTTNTLVHFSTLSSTQKEEVYKNVATLREASKLTQPNPNPSTVAKLVNSNNLTTQQLNQVRLNSNNIASFKNDQSILKSRGLFDLNHASTIQNDVTRNLFLGNPVFMNGKNDPSADDEKVAKPDRKKSCKRIINHLNEHHKYYCDAFDSSELKDVLFDLVFKEDKDYIIIIPSKAFIEMNKLSNKTKMLKIIGSHIALFHTKSNAPIMNNMSDSSLYEYQTLVKNKKIEIRRLDDKTIEINNLWIATLDENTDGHVYVMTNFYLLTKIPKNPKIVNVIEDGSNDTTKKTRVLEQVGKTQQSSKQVIKAEPTLIDIENENDPNLEVVRVEEDLPDRLNDKENTQPEEGTKIFMPVASHMMYKNKKMSVLVEKMTLNGYSSGKNMKNYISLNSQSGTNNNSLSSSHSASNSESIYLKTYSVDDIYARVQSTSLRETEYPRKISSYAIECKNVNTIDMDENLKMKEYRVDTLTTQIRKSELINHIAVLSFPLSCGERCSSVSFNISDQVSSKDIYMSADENIVMKFSNNLLESVSINTVFEDFPAYVVSDDDHGKDLNTLVSLQLSFDKTLFNKIYDKEILFSKFMTTIMPFCAPRIIKRLKSGGKALLTKPIPLVNSDKFSIPSDFTPRGGSATKRIMFMIGDNKATLLKNKKTLTLNKQTFASGSEKVDQYTRDRRNKSDVSFSDLVTKKGKARLLGITIADPLQSNKMKTFIFKLDNTVGVGRSRNLNYSATKGGLDMHFELNNKGNLYQIFIEYQLRDGPRKRGSSVSNNNKAVNNNNNNNNNKNVDEDTVTSSDNESTDTEPVMTSSTSSAMPTSSLKFADLLHDEASLLNKYDNMQTIGNAYMDIRSRKLAMQLNTKEKENSVKFFQSLLQQITSHIINSKMSLNTETVFTKTPSTSQNDTMINEKYLVPNKTYAMQFNSALNTHIADATIATSNDMTKAARQLFLGLLVKSSQEFNVADQKIYLHRLSGLVDVILCNLKK